MKPNCMYSNKMLHKCYVLELNMGIHICHCTIWKEHHDHPLNSVQVWNCIKTSKKYIYIWLNYIFKSLDNVYSSLNHHGGEISILVNSQNTLSISLKRCPLSCESITLFSTEILNDWVTDSCHWQWYWMIRNAWPRGVWLRRTGSGGRKRRSWRLCTIDLSLRSPSGNWSAWWRRLIATPMPRARTGNKNASFW